MLIDCGMEQEITYTRMRSCPRGITRLTMLLTHAHIDQAGMLPWIHARGFRGQVITTYATADLCSIMLKDSAHIQNGKWKNRKARRAGRGEVKPSIPCRMLRMCLAF